MIRSTRLLTRIRTCIWYCGFTPQNSLFIKQLLDHDVPVSSDIRRTVVTEPTTNLYGWLSHNRALNYEHLMSSEIEKIMVLKDEERLSVYLSEGRALPNDTKKGLDLYKLAVDTSWPMGCRLLLDHGMDLRPVIHPHVRFFRAIILYGDVDLLNFWLSVRPSLDPADREKLGSLEFALDWAVRLQRCLDASLFTVKLKAIISSLALQRRTLRAVVTEHFRDTKYVLQDDRLLDLQAWEVCRILEKRGIYIPAALKPSSICVYNIQLSRTLSVEILDALYEAGFRDHAEESRSNEDISFISPIFFTLARVGCQESWTNVLRALGWFLARGSDLHKLWPQSAIKGTHLLGSRLGEFFYREEWARTYGAVSPRLNEWINNRKRSCEAVSEQSKEGHANPTVDQDNTDNLTWYCMREALADKTPDLCKCYCSFAGCVPLTLLYKNFAISWGRRIGLRSTFALWYFDTSIFMLTSLQLQIPEVSKPY